MSTNFSPLRVLRDWLRRPASIGIGIGLSLILMVIAAFGVIPAIVGAGLQEVIDVVTILNSLRAGRRRE